MKNDKGGLWLCDLIMSVFVVQIVQMLESPFQGEALVALSGLELNKEAKEWG